MNRALRIDVAFDFICPWCLIGKRHLDNALQQFAAANPDTDIRLHWTPFILLPDTPIKGLPYQSFYVQRLGSPEAVARRRAQVQEAGDSVGLQFDFDAIRTMPNTLAAHRLVQHIGQLSGHAQQQALIEELYTGYFMHGKNIGDFAYLAHLAAKYGLPHVEAADYLNSPAEADSDSYYRQSLHAANFYGIGGVPGFTFNQRFPLSGAIPAASLLQAMQRAVAE